jgi:aminoglycoside phosphotransferase (APT) family kinase protein
MATIAERGSSAPVWRGLEQFAALPDWLNAATDPAQFTAALARAVPALASGDLTLQECDIGHVRIKRDVWTGVYTLTVAARGGAPRTIALRGTILPPGHPDPGIEAGTQGELGGEGWRAFLPELRVMLAPQPQDADLPSLPILTDPEQARAMLERSIRAASPAYADLRLERVAPKVMRYTPGSRCTVLYRLTYPAGLAEGRGWPELVVAKTYKGGKGKHAYEGMRALWDAPYRHGEVTLAEPLAFLPELNVLVQGPIREEQTLQELMAAAAREDTPATSAELQRVIGQTAAGLAGLHNSGVRFGKVKTWEDELAEVRGVVDNLASAVPPLAAAAAPLLAWLEARAAEHPADPITTAHGTFRPGQVLIYQGAIGFIDFDSFCQAEPSLDLSLFLRRTKDIALAELAARPGQAGEGERAAQLARAEAICGRFLDEYQAHSAVSRERVALWEALDLFTLVLHSWTKVKPERLQNATFALGHHLRTMGL